jgi:hypothetical protein
MIYKIKIKQWIPEGNEENEEKELFLSFFNFGGRRRFMHIFIVKIPQLKIQYLNFRNFVCSNVDKDTKK